MLVNCPSFICRDVVLRLLEQRRRWWNSGCCLASDRWIMGNLMGSCVSFVFPYFCVLHVRTKQISKLRRQLHQPRLHLSTDTTPPSGQYPTFFLSICILLRSFGRRDKRIAVLFFAVLFKQKYWCCFRNTDLSTEKAFLFVYFRAASVDGRCLPVSQSVCSRWTNDLW